MSLLEIRVGRPVELVQLRELRSHWPDCPPCSYARTPVDGPVQVTLEDGIQGNTAGFPTHIEDSKDRAALVFNELTYKALADEFPDCKETLVRGGFAENFVVNSPELLPSVVCIGDVFRIGGCVFEVSGSRYPCPKIDAWHNVNGLKKRVLEQGWSGYFLRVVESGTCCAGDDMTLLKRPHPGYSIEEVARGLWGPADQQDSSVEFLSYLADMPQLISRHFRDTARTRLNRIQNMT